MKNVKKHTKNMCAIDGLRKQYTYVIPIISYEYDNLLSMYIQHKSGDDIIAFKYAKITFSEILPYSYIQLIRGQKQSITISIKV